MAVTDMRQILHGIGIGDGTALGRLHLVGEAESSIGNAGSSRAASSPALESARFRTAQTRAQAALEAL